MPTTSDIPNDAGAAPRPERGGDVIIRVDGITLGWGDVVLLENASFEVKRGEIFFVVGGSGCGKSTLLRHLVGLEPPVAGTISVQGRPPRSVDEVGRPTFGVMFQSGALFGSMTVGDNVALPVRRWTALPSEAVAAVVRAKLGLVGLKDAASKLPSEISGGMTKRAAIARAMALEPDLLFLDEPSAGLDPVNAADLDELLKTVNAVLGTTVVLVSHELPSIFNIGKRCIMLDQVTKSLIADGDPRTLRDQSEDPRVHAFFNRAPAVP